MYARQQNGAIKRYTAIPKAWGNVIAGFDKLTSSEWQEAGFYDVVTPDYDSAIQKLGDLEWDSDSSTFTYPVINKTWTQTVAELKESKIANLKSIYNRKLAETDWYIIRASEGGTATPQSILDDRAALRTECGTKEAEINALTTKAAIASYSLPNLD
jgi:hypothetical protein